MRDLCWRAPAAALALLPLLSGCDRILDARRATLCRRAVPALAPPGVTVTIEQITEGPEPGSIRVDYQAGGPALSKGRPHWIVCRFSEGAGLDAVTTETGPVSGPSVYLLRHYFLDTPDAAKGDPGGG